MSHAAQPPKILPIVVLSVFALALTGTANLRADEEELSPELKAFVSRFNDDIKSRTPAVRLSAYKSLGELGEKGRSLRRSLCQGMLDSSQGVRVAAADSLKKIDPEMGRIALGIAIDKNINQVGAAKELREKGEPLTPLILHFANSLTPVAGSGNSFQAQEAQGKFCVCMEAAVAVGPKDPAVNKAVVAMLGNAVPRVRQCAVNQVEFLHNRKLALSAVLQLASNFREQPGTRVKAVQVVPLLVDENSKEKARKAIEALRFDEHAAVRDAVDTALKKLN
jgi:hypothetical protein